MNKNDRHMVNQLRFLKTPNNAAIAWPNRQALDRDIYHFVACGSKTLTIEVGEGGTQKTVKQQQLLVWKMDC